MSRFNRMKRRYCAVRRLRPTPVNTCNWDERQEYLRLHNIVVRWSQGELDLSSSKLILTIENCLRLASIPTVRSMIETSPRLKEDYRVLRQDWQRHKQGVYLQALEERMA